MSDLWYDNNKPDEDDEVIYNLCEDIRCLKERVAELEAGRDLVDRDSAGPRAHKGPEHAEALADALARALGSLLPDYARSIDRGEHEAGRGADAEVCPLIQPDWNNPENTKYFAQLTRHLPLGTKLYTAPQPVKVPGNLLEWKCEILDEIASDIYSRRYGSQAETAEILGITQPRVSAIANRKYGDFSLEAALTYKAMLAAQEPTK